MARVGPQRHRGENTLVFQIYVEVFINSVPLSAKINCDLHGTKNQVSRLLRCYAMLFSYL